MKIPSLKSIVNFTVLFIMFVGCVDYIKNPQDVRSKKTSVERKSETKVVEVKVVKPKTTEVKQVSPKPVAQNIVYIHGLGDYTESDLYTVRDGITDFYGYDVRIGEPRNYISSEYYATDEYLNSSMVVDLCYTEVIGRHVYVTNLPICPDQNLTYLISGFAKFNHMGSVVSTYQLKLNGNYRNTNLQNVANHEIAHNLGLIHCEDNGPCLMNAKGTKVSELCDICELKIKI
jgi:predicted Zn-dependent protease